MDEGFPETIGFTIVDQNMRYFVVTRVSLVEGEPVSIHIWLQVAAYVNADSHMVELEIPQPVVDHQNRRRCDDIKLDKKLGAHNWYKQVILSIFHVYVVYTYNDATQSLAYEEF